MGLKDLFSKKSEEKEEEYIEVDLNNQEQHQQPKIYVKPFILRQFEDVTPILNELRLGTTIAIVNIKQLKNKDLVELKRAVAKLKKTADALEGKIAGFGEDTLIITPSFAEISKEVESKPITGNE